ncbi:MAG: TetR family transcriptional regulator [Actinobacteria bacterium]|nr:TetR family transcriptional regulator [Actinomycetota bacterium]
MNKGYQAATLDLICEHRGIGRSSFYRYEVLNKPFINKTRSYSYEYKSG